MSTSKIDRIEVIFFDFDGVILDSMPIRTQGYRDIFSDYDRNVIEQLVNYHLKNGGISRFAKIRYFYEKIIGTGISNKKVMKLADKFSVIMRKQLVDPDKLILDTMNFIKANHTKCEMHIVSGSEQEELCWLCSKLGIDRYFKTIDGSPTPKSDLIGNILKKFNYQRENCVMIGDSINDYEASQENKISFLGYNNQKLKKLPVRYIDTFINLKFSFQD